MVADHFTHLGAANEDETLVHLTDPHIEYYYPTFPESDQLVAATTTIGRDSSYLFADAHSQHTHISNLESQPQESLDPSFQSQSQLDPSLLYNGNSIANQWLATASNPVEETFEDFFHILSTGATVEKQQLFNVQEESSHSSGMVVSEGPSANCHEPCPSNEVLLAGPYCSTSLLFPETETPGIAEHPSHSPEQPQLSANPAPYSAFTAGGHGSLSSAIQLQLRMNRSSSQTPQKRQPVKRKPRTQRRGPLSAAARDKADSMRMLGACWRCRRYRKPVCCSAVA